MASQGSRPHVSEFHLTIPTVCYLSAPYRVKEGILDHNGEERTNDSGDPVFSFDGQDFLEVGIIQQQLIHYGIPFTLTMTVKGGGA